MFAARLQLEELLGGKQLGYRACARVLANNSHQLGLILGNGFQVLSEGSSWPVAFTHLDVARAKARLRELRTAEAHHPTRRAVL